MKKEKALNTVLRKCVLITTEKQCLVHDEDTCLDAAKPEIECRFLYGIFFSLRLRNLK
jgi:hypothetical protein